MKYGFTGRYPDVRNRARIGMPTDGPDVRGRLALSLVESPLPESPLPESSRAGSDADDVALRDAAAIAERVRADEAAADEARARYLVEPLRPLDVFPALAPHLQTGEQPLIVRRNVLIEMPLEGAGEGRRLRGDLCITDRRLLMLDHELVEAIDLATIIEIGVVGDRTLQVSVSTGRGIAIDLDQPRLFRVQIQAARDPAAQTISDRLQAESR